MTGPDGLIRGPVPGGQELGRSKGGVSRFRASHGAVDRLESETSTPAASRAPAPQEATAVTTLRLTLVRGCLVPLWAFLQSGERPPRTGPETEKRFPPLKVPPGFKATLFACDPLIEYPSVIAPGPRPNSLFVAVDY